MKRFIDVPTGEVMAGQGDVVLKSATAGACMVIAAYDSVRKIGGLAHAMFMEGGLDEKRDFSVLNIATKAIDEMIKNMTLLGADQEDIEVRLVAGENIHPTQNDHGTIRSISSTIELLRQKHLRCIDHTDHDAGNLHVSLDVQSGQISYV